MFEVSFFSEFKMKQANKVLDESNIKSEILVQVLAYFLLNRKKKIANEELMQIFWAGDEVDNPAAALKNVVYRLRKCLEKFFGKGEYILTGRGYYAWNNKYSVDIDIERFVEDNHKVVDANKEIWEQKSDLESIITKYKGKFLPKYSNCFWIMNMGAVYHSMYLDAAYELAGIYYECGEFAELDRLCATALLLEPHDETLNTYKIKALVKQKKYQLAQNYVNVVEKNIKKEFGEKVTFTVDALKDTLPVHLENKKNISPNDIKEQVRKIQKTEKAYLCSYETFLEVYEIVSRRNQRRSISDYIVVFYFEKKNKRSGQAIQIDKIVNEFVQYMQNRMRLGDLITQYNHSEVIAMLCDCSYENAINIAGRIITTFRADALTEEVNITIEIGKVKADV